MHKQCRFNAQPRKKRDTMKLTIHELGSRVHPITNVLCDYFLCEYMGGEARNIDLAEDVDLAWANKATLARYIPAKRIFPPVLEALECETGLKETKRTSSRAQRDTTH